MLCSMYLPRKRLVILFLGLFALFSLLLVAFFKLQVVEGEKWTRVANRQHRLCVIEPAKRGLFYSNTSLKKGHPEQPQPFVIDVPKFHLFADPKAIPEECKDEVAQHLERLLSLRPEDFAKLRVQLGKNTHSRRLILWMSPSSQEKLSKWWQGYAKQKKLPRNALFFIQDYKRSYPFGKLLGQILHTVREEKDSKNRQSIPTGGLELVFNRVLQGKDGKRQILRSPRHPMETGTILSSPEDGANVYLTINHYLQAIAEEEIEKAVLRANAVSGWAILMHPVTGEIFALAQYPFFDPSHYQDYFNDPKLSTHTKVHAITDPFEPGSTMKPITLGVALLANEELLRQGKPPLFSPDEKIATANGVFPGRSRPISDVHAHRYLNMNMALQKSSNIYMARLIQRVVERLGATWYRNTLHHVFGFGQKTGIELPAESPGVLPTPGKIHPNGTTEWSTPTPFSIAFGHNILANSIQMVRVYGILANGGKDVQPHLVRQIIRPQQEILLDHTTPQEAKTLLDPHISSQVVNAMKYVTKPGGSASKANIPGYTTAGKTATSEKIVNGTYSKRNHISTFIGFAPAKNPEFVLLIAIDEPECKYIPGVGKNQFGGNCAAPAFRDIGLRTLQYLGVEPDDPQKTDWSAEGKALRSLYLEWNS